MSLTEKETQKKKFSFGKFMAWKSSDVSSAGVFWIVNTYLLFFSTNTLGINPALAGTIILISNIIDAVTDVLIGYFLDRSPNGRFGKYRPYDLSMVAVIGCVILMFVCPSGENVSLGFKVAWIFIFYTLVFGVFNTARVGANVPYMIRAFDNDQPLIGRVSAYGGLVTTMGAAVVTFLFPKLLSSFGGEFDETNVVLPQGAYVKAILIIMIPLAIISVFRFIFVKENKDIDAGKQAIDFKLRDVGNMLKTNKYIWFYGILIFAFNAIQTLGVLPYYFDVFFPERGGDVGIISLMSYFLLPLMLVMPILLKKMTASKLIIYSSFIAILGYVINFFAGSVMPLVIVGSILTALVTLPISYLGNYIMTHVINYNEYKGIPRQDATTYSVASGIFSQLGQGFGPFFTGLVLDSFMNGTVKLEGYDTAVKLLYSIVPLLLVVLIVLGALFLHRLEKKAPEINEVINK